MINTRSGSAPGTAELALAPERVYWAADSADGPASFGARDIHGRPLWQQELPGQAVGVTALSETGVLVQTGPAAEAAWDQLRCYSPSGKPLWRGVLHIKSGSRPELASDGALYAVVPAASGLRGYDLARLNPADGSPLWRQPLGTTEEMKAFAMADGGVLAAGATLVRCGETGERNWELPADTLTLLPVAPVSVRGTDLALVRLGGRYGALAGRLALFEARTAAPGRVWLLSTDLRQPDSMAALGRTLLLGQRGQPPAAYRLPPLQEPAQLIAER
jgi:outer membrane protein assembly factor BamB